MSEHTEQVALFEWKQWMENKHPELEMMFAIPMGGERPDRAGKNLKAEGVQSGILDVFLDVPRNDYHGARLELKIKGGTVSDAQKIWIDRFKRYGYFTEVCFGWIEMARVICTYLEIDEEGLDVWKKV